MAPGGHGVWKKHPATIRSPRSWGPGRADFAFLTGVRLGGRPRLSAEADDARMAGIYVGGRIRLRRTDTPPGLLTDAILASLRLVLRSEATSQSSSGKLGRLG
jgi:hypothetical protein